VNTLRILLLIVTFFPAVTWPVQQYDVRITDRKPQSRGNFVQGLEIVDGYLYVSTGTYGQSHLLRYKFADGSLDVGRKMDSRIFAEGLTVLGERIYQLTWRAKTMLVYDTLNLQPQQSLPIPGEGWGLTNNGKSLIYSDGSEHLHFMSPVTGEILRTVVVTEQNHRVTQLNELEWIDGNIWANVWRTDRIVIIDPESGQVSGSINLEGLLPASEYRPGTDVLNGIARNPADDSTWVTGKRWPWLYQIELIPR
jgi:glutamine cyclotransferase